MSAKSLVDQISMFVRSKNGFFFCLPPKSLLFCSLWRDYFRCQNSKCRKQIDTFISWKIDIIFLREIFWRFPISFNEFQKHKGKLLCSINLQTKYFWQVFQVHTLVLDRTQIELTSNLTEKSRFDYQNKISKPPPNKLNYRPAQPEKDHN